jgi:iron complex transport system substrate-binding protein
MSICLALTISICAGNSPSGQVAPKRIVAIGPNSAEIVCALGACDAIVGVSKFCVYPPELKDRPQVGGQFDPDLERITALRPDLVITRGSHGGLERLCEERGIAVYHDETDSFEGVEKAVMELGALLGREEEAKKVNSEFRAKLDEIRAQVSGKRRPRVFLTVSRQPDRLANIMTAGRGTFLHEMIEIAGGINVFGDVEMRYPQVSPEAVLAKQPDVIIELLPEVVLTAELESQLRKQWAELGPLPAAKRNRVYFLTDDHCLIPSPRYHVIVEKVARILHP